MLKQVEQPATLSSLFMLDSRVLIILLICHLQIRPVMMKKINMLLLFKWYFLISTNIQNTITVLQFACSQKWNCV